MSDVTDNIDDVGLAHHHSVAGKNRDVALGMVSNVSRQRHRDGMIGIGAPGDGDAASGFVG